MIVFCHKLTVAFNAFIKDDMTMIMKTILNLKKRFLQSVTQVAHMKKYW